MTFPTRWQVPSGYSTTNDPDVFPVLRGQKFLAKKSPNFPPTIKKVGASGRRVYLQLASQPTWDFKLTYGKLSNAAPTVSDLQVLQSFFLTHLGGGQPFFFYDPEDNIVTAQTIGVGDGTTTAFQLCRTVNPAGANGFVENIYAVLGGAAVTVGNTQKFGPQLDNLLTWSQAFTNSVWAKSSITAVDNAITGPDGTTDASTLTGSAADSFIGQTITATVGTSMAGSVWLKVPSGSVNVDIFLTDGAGNTVLPCTLTTSWQRFSVTRVAAGTSVGFQIGGASSITSGMVVHAFGAQLVKGSLPLTYQATSTAGGDYTIGANGIITFNTAPAAAAQISWSGQFLFLCHFAQDNLDAAQVVSTLWTQDGLMFESIKP